MSFFSSFKKLVGINNVYQSHISDGDLEIGLGDQFGPIEGASCVAFDSHNKLLAVASNSGVIKIYGRPGLELTLRSPSPRKITNLAFLVETGHIISTSGKELMVSNLGTAKIQCQIEYPSPITCISSTIGSAFVYVGLASGEIHILNTDGWIKSLYKILPKDAELPPGVTDLSIIAICINPVRDDILLIGYACGAINEWDIKAKKVLRHYLSNEPLRSLTWDPSGTKMMAGHQNGELVLWHRKKFIAEENYHPLVNPSKPSELKKVFWLASTKGDQYLVSLGGTDKGHGIVIEKPKQKLRAFIPMSNDHSKEIRDMCVVYSNAANQTQPQEPIAIATVNSIGQISVFPLLEFGQDEKKKPSDSPAPVAPPTALALPIPFSLFNVSVISSKAISGHLVLLEDLINVGNISPEEVLKLQHSRMTWPLTGGQFRLDRANKPLILITLLSNNTIIFWDMSMRNAMVPIYRIKLPGSPPKNNISCFDFCESSRILHVGVGEDMYVYRFSLEPKDVNLVTVEEISAAGSKVVAGNVNPTTATGNVNPATTATVTQETAIAEPATQENNNQENAAQETASSPQASPSQRSPAQVAPSQASPSQRSPTQSAPSQASPSPYNTSQSSLPTQPPGFQLSYHIIFASSCTQTINFESGLDLVAVSTTNGRVSIFKPSNNYSLVFQYRPPQNTLPSPPLITNLQFYETMIGNEEHLIVAMGQDSGNVINRSITNPNKPIKEIPAKRSPIIDLKIVHAKGNNITLWKQPWISTEISNSSKDYQPTHQTEKLMIVCTINDIRTYRIPDMEVQSQIDCKAPMAWFGTITLIVNNGDQRVPEFTLVGIDMASNISFFTLMNLNHIVPATRSNLTALGVNGISPLSTRNTACLDDGTLILHTDASETYIVHTLPYTENRAVTPVLGPEPPKMVVKKSKSIIGLIGKDKDVNFEDVFGPRQEPPTAPPKPTTSSKASSAQSELGEMKSVMSENMDRLNQRGEKLSDIADRSAQLADSSANFLVACKQLSSQSKNSWF